MPNPRQISGTSFLIKRAASSATGVRSVNSIASILPFKSALAKGTACFKSSTISTAIIPTSSIFFIISGDIACCAIGYIFLI